LLDIEKLRGRVGEDHAQNGSGTLPHDYDEKRSGSAEAFSGSIRAAFGPSSGPVPGEKNAGSSSENAAPDAVKNENARPRGGENHAAA
jgi:hypothetical protein